MSYKNFNKVILIGLLVSGLIAEIGFFLTFLFPSEIIGLVFVYAHVLSGFFSVFAIISFVIGTILFLIGRMNSYWQTLYPINIGISALLMTSWQYNLNMPVIWILTAFIFAFVITFILHKINATKSRWLLIILIVVPFITAHYKIVFWDTLIIGLIFLGLSLAMRSRKRNGI